MTLAKSTVLRQYYERRHGTNHQYFYWTATRLRTTVEDHHNIKSFVVFKMGDLWCWGMDADIEAVKAWRYDNRLICKPGSRLQLHKEALARGEKPEKPKRKRRFDAGKPRTEKGNVGIQNRTRELMYEVADLVEQGWRTGDIARQLDLKYVNAYYYVKVYKEKPELFVDKDAEIV